MHYVITGNIGCGKSTAISQLKLLLPTFSFYSIDDIVAQAYLNEQVQQQLTAHFGFYEKHKVRDLFFSNPEAKQIVEGVINPYVSQQLQDILSRKENSITEYPVVFEYNQTHLFDKVIFIWADDEVRIQRVIQRNGFTRDQVLAVMRKQISQEEKKDKADFIVVNNDSLDALQNELEKLVLLID